MITRSIVVFRTLSTLPRIPPVTKLMAHGTKLIGFHFMVMRLLTRWGPGAWPQTSG